MSFKISMRGDKELSKLLSQAPEIFQQAADKATEEIASRISRYAFFMCPYKTGFLRNSIYFQRKGGGYGGRSIPSWVVGAKAPYATYVELGTRYMEARPFMRNAFIMVQPDIPKIQKEQILAYWRSANR